LYSMYFHQKHTTNGASIDAIVLILLRQFEEREPFCLLF
jgi:hypothetical protein